MILIVGYSQSPFLKGIQTFAMFKTSSFLYNKKKTAYII